MIFNLLYESEDVTVNHRVGGSSPSQGAINGLKLIFRNKFVPQKSIRTIQTRFAVSP